MDVVRNLIYSDAILSVGTYIAASLTIRQFYNTAWWVCSTYKLRSYLFCPLCGRDLTKQVTEFRKRLLSEDQNRVMLGKSGGEEGLFYTTSGGTLCGCYTTFVSQSDLCYQKAVRS
jgi:hypothetical protein